MPVEFVHFGSSEAFFLFRWMITERKEDLDLLIAKAFELAEADPMFEAGREPCLCARDALADLIADEYLPNEFEREGMFSDFGCNPADGTENLRSITEQFLVLAANAICYSTVAEALLRYREKWTPDQERPEIM